MSARGSTYLTVDSERKKHEMGAIDSALELKKVGGQIDAP